MAFRAPNVFGTFAGQGRQVRFTASKSFGAGRVRNGALVEVQLLLRIPVSCQGVKFRLALFMLHIEQLDRPSFFLFHLPSAFLF